MERKEKKVYLSDPCTGRDEDERDATFQIWESFFEVNGLSVFNPRKNGLPRSSSWQEHMRKDIAELCGCDFLVRLSGYTSRGVKFEEEVAKILGIKIVYYDEIERCGEDKSKFDYLFT